MDAGLRRHDGLRERSSLIWIIENTFFREAHTSSGHRRRELQTLSDLLTPLVASSIRVLSVLPYDRLRVRFRF